MTDRVCFIRISEGFKMRVYEVHEASEDGRDWLTQVIKFTNKEWPNFQHQVMGAFAKSARCGISDCARLVEVGAHLTFDGDQLLIVPCCKYHNGKGNLDKLGRHSTLKPHQLYATIFLKPGFVLEDSEGKFYLTQALPNLVD